MTVLGLDRLPTSTKDALLDFLATRIANNQDITSASSRRYIFTDEQAARATALEAMGRVEAYKDIYQVFNDNKPWVDK